MTTDKQLIGLKEAERLFSTAYTTLLAACQTGDLPAIRPHAQWRVVPGDVMDWLRRLSDERENT